MSDTNPQYHKYSDYESPLMYLMMAATNTIQAQMGVQSEFAKVEQGLSTGAMNTVNWNNQQLENLSNQIKNAPTSSSTDRANLQKLTNQYTTEQTAYSTTNQNFSNVVNAGNTTLSNLNTTEAQETQFCSTVNEVESGFTGLISGWAS